MALSGENNGGAFDANYFVQKATVKKCTIQYRQANKFDADKVSDVVLDIVLDVAKKDGSTFEKTVTISGNYKRNGDNTVAGWSTAFKIKAFFNTMGLNSWSTDDLGVFPENLTSGVIGKSLWLLSYRSTVNGDGKRQYRTYKLFGRTAEEVETRFLKEVDGDYPPYQYEPADDGSSFPYGDIEKSAVTEDVI